MIYSEIQELTATRQHFQEYKIYTKLPPKTPMWIAFWEEERRRCLEGYHIGSDYIPGYYYDYLNYSPILQLDDGDNVRASVVEGFPRYWDGLYDYFHYIEEAENLGEHAMFYGSRGKGKSYTAASMMVRNYFHIKKSKNFAIASDYQFLTDDGLLTKTWPIMYFRDEHTPWAKRRQLSDTQLHKKSGTKVTLPSGIVVERGWQSEIMGLSVKDDIDKIRGKRGKLAVIEEAGNLSDLDGLVRVMRRGFEQGGRSRGLILMIGTGGTQGAAGADIINIFKQPSSQRVHAVSNKWSPGREDEKVGFFFPVQQNYDGAYDILTGKSDIPKAIELVTAKHKIEEMSLDPFALIKARAEEPLTPEDAMMQISGTQFPVLELRKQEAEIETKPHQYRHAEFHVVFELDRDSQQYVAKQDPNPKPIYTFPHYDNKFKPGCFIIYEHPKTDHNNNVFHDRYIAGIDSYDHDESSTRSLGSLHIMDTWTERIVAEYAGRPPKSTDFYEMCRRGLLYYAARTHTENLNKGIFDYFDGKGTGSLHIDELRISREATNEPVKGTSRKRGYTPHKQLNTYARSAITQWLLGSTKNTDLPEELNVHKYRGIATIKELISWNDMDNFDRVDSLALVCLYLLDRKKYQVDSTVTYDPTYLGNDPYFQKLLPSHMKKREAMLKNLSFVNSNTPYQSEK